MNTNLYRNLRFWPMLLGIGFALPLVAQEDLEEVVVTGSYIARPADRPQPIQVLDIQDIANAQRNNVSEMFRDMSVSNGTFTGFLNADENFGSTTSTVNLRGLGPRATLVLLNGKRQTNDGGVGPEGVTAVDINALAPAIMLERVEVLTDGASALYGSDAVAGVVNMITRNNFEGFEFDISGQEIDRSGATDNTFGVLFGSQGEQTSIVAGIEIANRDELVTQDLYDLDRLGIATVSSFGNPGSLQPIGGMGAAGRFPDPICGDPQLGGVPFGGVPLSNRCGLLLSVDRVMVQESERITGLSVVSHDFGNGVTGEAEIGFSRIRTSGTNNTFPINDVPRPVVPANNPGIIAENARSGLPISDYQVWQRLRKHQDPNFNLKSRRTSETWRAAFSLAGDFNDNWNWNASATFSENTYQGVTGDTIRSRYDNALRGFGGPACDLSGPGAAGGDANCLWYNPLGNSFLASPGDPNYNSLEILEFMFGPVVTEGIADLATIDFVATGTLTEWASLAVGAQTRDQSFSQDSDPISNAGAFAFRSQPVADYSGNRDADAIFAELVLFPSDNWEVQLAVRNESYSGGADSTDPKVGVLWTPTDGLYLRATAGTSFRVAGEPQTFGIELGRGAGVELCGLGCPPAAPENVDAQATTRGDPGLKPEESENFTLGLTWDITDSVTLDLNYWSIEFDNLIVQESLQAIWFADLADGTIDDPRIVLNPAAGTNVVNLLIANDIQGFDVSYINEDSLETDGIDFRVDWNFESGANQFGLSFFGTQTLTYDISSPAGGVIDGLGSLNAANNGYATPETAASLSFEWSRSNHFAQATYRHTSELTQDIPDDVADTIVKDFNTLDLIYRYSWEMGNSPMTFSAGMLNATDEEDPQIGGLLTTVNTRTYDIRGRMYRLGFSMGF